MSLQSEISKPIQKAIQLAKVKTATNRLAQQVQSIILKRTEKGEFIGGNLANKTYSNNDLQAWKLGKVTYLKNGKISIKKSGVKTVRFNKNDIYYGKKGYVVKGGYRTFRRKSGRNTAKVDLTMTGKMLNSLNYRVQSRRNRIGIIFGVSASNNLKAFYTNQQREWLGLDNSEQSKIAASIEEGIEANFK